MVRESRSDLVLNLSFLLFLCGSVIIVGYPLLYVVSSSFSNPQEVISGNVWFFPVDFTLAGYNAVFQNKQVITGFLNSFFYMITGTLLNLVMTVLAAYPLSRRELKGRNAIMFGFVFTILFSGGLIPNYLLIKNLGMIDTRLALIIPAALSIWNMILMLTFFKSTIPNDLYEAASMDGCSDLNYLIRIILPLSTPILAVVALYVGVNIWNSYFNAMLYLKSIELMPLQIILRNILVLNKIDTTMIQNIDLLARRQGMADVIKFSIIVIASLPVLAFYPFVQKYFVRGLMIGAIKG